MSSEKLKINYSNVENKLQEIESGAKKKLLDNGNSYVTSVKKIASEEGAFKENIESTLNDDKNLFVNFSNLSGKINAGIRNVCNSFKKLDSSMAKDMQKTKKASSKK
ncbi:hypothetical protein [Lachnobacterium bovis]|uniref:Type VII secretion effector, SACOL2603 family n=1 Tax=Lachnobacterium bovis DSM 14045 TaxID=1122142 RepID=A0A1H3MUL6_9FIRM|nr:hypothetical protein [Lachnobacterium bovis]SDY80263.1 hypothetical protein SAMN02910414_02409 [Lachnobacterium bovis DSM 14045]